MFSFTIHHACVVLVHMQAISYFSHAGRGFSPVVCRQYRIFSRSAWFLASLQADFPPMHPLQVATWQCLSFSVVRRLTGSFLRL